MTTENHKTTTKTHKLLWKHNMLEGEKDANWLQRDTRTTTTSNRCKMMRVTKPPQQKEPQIITKRHKRQR